ncbi:uncharacterized protein K441DRAFT_692738 [Cenococcum geophilum 1.58]|uniref:uncharacterized protein n=1 Tax=Cenococcum geophilum 1.58 TaxID=794803 RepID=UPI00358FD5F8|nr:hypothetical protein K441DRAFT_692738 [Cenococcum geophilum 1.58]
MEGLSIASTIIELIEFSTTLLSRLNEFQRSAKWSHGPSNLGIYHVYVEILEEMVKSLPSIPQALPRGAALCLELCRDRLYDTRRILDEFQRKVEKVLGSKTKQAFSTALSKEAISKIEGQLEAFMSHVRTLREILTDATVNRMAYELQAFLGSQARFEEELITTLIAKLREAAMKDNEENSTSESHDYRQNLQRLEEQLRANAQRFQQDPVLPLEPYSFSAKIIHDRKDESDYAVIRGILDTGCHENWVSLEAVQRAEIEHQMGEPERESLYTAFGGQPFQARGKIDITWFTVNPAMSRKTTFLVHEAPPFDMVLGKLFIQANNVLMFNEPALALRHANLTEEELLEMEKQARENADSQKQISAIRQAKNAAARERMRQEKAASRISTPGTLRSQKTSFLYPRLDPLQSGASSLSRRLSMLSVQSSASVPHQVEDSRSDRPVSEEEEGPHAQASPSGSADGNDYPNSS